MNPQQRKVLIRSIRDQIDTLRGRSADIELRLRQLETDYHTLFDDETPKRPQLMVCCSTVWSAPRKPCEAWGAPSSHACKKAPGHDGIHVCPCGSRHH
jgi:hypothetical protein